MSGTQIPPLVLTEAEWEGVATAIEQGQDHPLDQPLEVSRVVVVAE